MKNLILFIVLLYSSIVQATFNNGSSSGGAITGSVSVTNFPASQPVSIPSVTVLPMSTQVQSTDDGLVTNSVLHGLTTAGGGAYVDVKVTPSGSLAVDTTSDTLASEATLSTLNGKIPSQGSAAASASLPVVIGDSLTVTGTAQSVLNTNLLTGNVSDWYDAKAFRSVSFQVLGGAGIASGNVTFEQTNDSTNNGVTLPVYESSTISSTAITTLTTIGANTIRMFEAPVTSRYVRVRINLAFTGGTVSAIAHFSQLPYTPTRLVAFQGTSANMMMTLGTVATGISIPVQNAQLVADVASSAITTTTTSSAAQTPTLGASYEWNVIVTAVSGTNPTMDLVIQESDDTSTNWFDIYHFPRITATGAYRTPRIAASGNRYRYVQTIAGTSPSFTRAVNRLSHSADGNVFKQFFNRTIDVNTLNSTTSTFYAEGVKNFQLVFSVGAITTTATQLQLQGSDDGTNWYSIGTPLTAVASSVVQSTINDRASKFVRAIVSTAGSGVTSDYVLIKGF